MYAKPDQLRGTPIITPFTAILGMVAAIGVFFLIRRFVFGLGAVTNLSAGYPWGLWVTWDLVIGTALGCGGFAMAILIYAFNNSRWHPLMRPALLGGMLGYLMASIAAIVDMGRWWQFYSVLLPWRWNSSSIMLETALCVTAYTFLLMIEFSPVVLERLGLSKWQNGLKKVMWFIIALGMLLPMMHQSSLGSIVLVLGYKLSPLYNTPFLPLLFVVGALTMGYSLVIVEATVVTRSFNLPSEHALLARLSPVVGWIMVAWLALRWGDLVWRGALGDALRGTGVAASFWIENALAVFATLAFLVPRARSSEVVTFLAGAALMAFGLLYRFNTYLIGYQPAVDGYQYFPAVPEILVTLGMISLEILMYLTLIKLFPVLSVPSGRQTAPA
jgi:Ni/Fe-hydrogenase subunit HybB-like protein